MNASIIQKRHVLRLLFASVTAHVVPLNIYFKSYFSLSFKIQQTGSQGQSTELGLWAMTEQGGVNIRARHAAPEVCGPAALRPHVSSAPVSSSRPSPCLSPLEYRIKQPREPFIPNRMPPLVTEEALQQDARGWQSLTLRNESQYPAEVA